MKTSRILIVSFLFWVTCAVRAGAALALPQTLPADNITTNSATLHGASVWNKKQPGYVAFQIRKQGARWPLSHTPWQRVARGQTNVVFAANVTGLKPGTNYQFRAVRYIAGVTRYGAALSFTPPARPVAVTGTAQNILGNSALLTATVDPNGLATDWAFEWVGPQGGNYLAGGQTNGANPVLVQFLVSNLQTNSGYSFRIWASNDEGTSAGAFVAFNTGLTNVGAPFVLTSSATGMTTNSAILNGSVNPNSRATTAWFEWAPTAAYGYSTAPVSLPVGANVVPIQAVLTNLMPGTMYHFRMVATNTDGASVGGDLAFTTLALPVIVPGPPAVATLIPTDITTNSATLHGSANPNGLATTAWFEWGTVTNYGNATTPQALGAGGSPVAVQVSLSSLLTDTNYHYRLVASNSAGVVYGSDVIVTPTLLLYLYAGETWTYDFHDLPYLYSYALPGDNYNSGFQAIVLPGSQSPDSAVRLEFSTLGFADLQPPATGATVSFFGNFLSANPGGQGRITVLTGSVVIASIILNVDRRPGGQFHYVYGGNTVIPTRLPQPALIATQFVSAVSATSAVVQANINALNLPSGVFVQWGTTTNYGSATGSAYLDRDYVYPVSLTVSNLLPNTAYHWRTVVTNSGGVSVGEDLTFTTEVLAPPF